LGVGRLGGGLRRSFFSGLTPERHAVQAFAGRGGGASRNSRETKRQAVQKTACRDVNQPSEPP
jgi:hypothetical protein